MTKEVFLSHAQVHYQSSFLIVINIQTSMNMYMMEEKVTISNRL